MKPNLFNPSRLFAVVIVAISITLLAWQQKQKRQELPRTQYQSQSDTIPKDKERKIYDLDDALEELEHANIDREIVIRLNTELAEIGPRIAKELTHAQIEVETALEEADLDKIKMEIDVSLKELDIDKLKTEISETIDKVDWKRIKAEVDESMEKADWNELKTELEKLKDMDIKVEMKEIEATMKNLKPELEEKLAGAKVQIEKAKAGVKEYKGFVDGLEKDGLINKKENYSIKHKNGELIINGKTQPAAVYDKYRSFLEKHPAVTIEKTEDDFDIDNPGEFN